MSVETTEPWRVRLLGGLEARRGDVVVTHFRTRKTASLFAFLAYHTGSAHTRDRMVELLWPDQPADAGRNSLSTALWTLRKTFEREGGTSLLQADRDSLRLAPDHVRTDAAEFEEALEQAARPGADEEACLETALHLYRGELLRGYFEPWVVSEQQRLADRYFHAAHRLTTIRQQQGDLSSALATARRAVTVDPLREESHCLLMRLFLSAEHPVEAVRQYRELERLLTSELDVQPGPIAQALRREAHGRVALPPSPSTPPPPPAASASEEEAGGAVPLASRSYVAREEDVHQREAVRRGESLVLVRGPRQVGKSSLLARGLEDARELGAAVALTDVAALGPGSRPAREFLREVLSALAEQLELPEPAPWSHERGPVASFDRGLRREVMSAVPNRLVWGLDNADALFGTECGSEVFALFRSWHNARALEPSGPWSRLTLLITYATEAHLFIEDLEQSPFNVGTRLDLGDFSAEQIEELNARHHAPLDQKALQSFARLVGGHPYLVRRGLLALRRGVTLPELEGAARLDGGPFAGHLRRLERSLRRDAVLLAAVKSLLLGQGCLGSDEFYRLRSAGVLTGERAAEARFRCALYECYLRAHLE